MNTNPTKSFCPYFLRGRRDAENRPPLNAATANVAASTVSLTGVSASGDDEKNDNESHLDCKPKAKKDSQMKNVINRTTDDDDSLQPLIDLPIPAFTSPPVAKTSATLSGLDKDSNDDIAATVTETTTATTLETAVTTNVTKRRCHEHYSSPRPWRRRRCRHSSIDSSRDNDESEVDDATLARQLQEQEDKQRLEQEARDLQEDEAMALKLQEQQEQEIIELEERQREQEMRDEQEASWLQKQFEMEKQLIDEKHQKAAEEMSTSVEGRAWTFVEKVLALDASLKQKYHTSTTAAAAAAALSATTTTTSVASSSASNKVSAIAKDDMVFLCEQMLHQQEVFRIAGKPIMVDLGFHYTRNDNLSRIRTNGLLSKSEREGRNITSPHHGSNYGDGIYTSDDHSLGGCTGQYGDTGIIVARLKGTEKYSKDFSGDHDCNQSRTRAITVLKSSAQCLALVEFHRSMLFPTTTAMAAAAAAIANATALAAVSAAAVSAAPQAVVTASTATLPAAFQALHATATASVASSAAAEHPHSTSVIIPAVDSGIIGEYCSELQKIVDETFNKKS